MNAYSIKRIVWSAAACWLLCPACSSNSDSDVSHEDAGTIDGNDTLESGPSDVASDAPLSDAKTDSSGPDVIILPDSGSACPSNILCGEPVVCCEEGTECVDAKCLPTCETNVRCGADSTICCPANNACISGTCTPPGKPCKDAWDCDEKQFCEPTLNACLPQPEEGPTCEYRPPKLPFDPVLEWSWTGSTILPKHNQVINMPVVIDFDTDSIPEVVIVTSDNFSGTGAAYLRLLDGVTGKEKWPATVDAYKPEYAVNPRATPAAADIDGDGKPEIVTASQAIGAIAFRADGSVLWKAKLSDGTTLWNENTNSITTAIADMDGDGKGEIVLGGVVFNSKGILISGLGRAFKGSQPSNYGAVSIIADVDGNGVQDVVTGAGAWKLDGSTIWTNASPDGYPAIADFDGDGVPELVVVSQGQVRVHNATTGALLAGIEMPGTGAGGPPTIADFDADGQMEISSANGNVYSVFEYTSKPKPTLSVKWRKDTQDLSSNVTGSSVFDFEGDGAAEVVYGDECYVRVYDGNTGDELFKTASTSGTIHEYPVLVDVDGDNRTEFVVVSNNLNHSNLSKACPDYTPDIQSRTGVFVYGDANNKWVRTRRIWNQHAYHITNINADGTLPAPEHPSWKKPLGFNNYRVSNQGEGVFNAPDLQVSLEISTIPCPTSLLLRAKVMNVGSLGVPAGVEVAFFTGKYASGQLLAKDKTTKPLLPGSSETVTASFTIGTQTPPFDFYVLVDGTTPKESAFDECLEDNNHASAGDVECPIVK